jgi:4'-phosphopantetheinyl transferase EntD
VARALVRQHQPLRTQRAGGCRRPAGGRRYRAPVYPPLAAELESSIINRRKKPAGRSGLPFPLALTLAFSAKESGFKASRPQYRRRGFRDFQMTYIRKEICASALRRGVSAAMD